MELSPLKKFNLKSFQSKSPQSHVTTREIMPLIEDLSEFGQTIRNDMKNMQDCYNKINEEHEKLRRDVDERFTAIEARIDSVISRLEIKYNDEVIKDKKNNRKVPDDGDSESETDLDLNILGADFPMRLPPFTGEGDISFSTWLRKFEDYADAQSRPWNSKQKARKLKFFLDGLPREEYETLTNNEKEDFDVAVGKLRQMFESPKMRNLARQKLMNCKQKEGETVHAYAERLRRAVKSATVGLSEQTFQESGLLSLYSINN